MLNEQTAPAFSQTGGRNVARWIYCCDGQHASVRLSLIPNPQTAKGSMAVLAEDLLAADEKRQVELH
jgi:hypothetical protein